MGAADEYKDLECHLWMYFLNQRYADFYIVGRRYNVVATDYILDDDEEWFDKMDMLEMVLKYLADKGSTNPSYAEHLKLFRNFINKEFERHNYAYRIVDKSVVEITSKEEKETVEIAIVESPDNIKMHLTNALEAYAKKPVGDYAVSIKESITAVEALCREMTGKDTLGKALNDLEKKESSLPKVLKLGMEKLYAYTNDEKTGIRHALMDPDGAYVPGAEEARYMLIVCSAFINYLRDKFK